MWTKKKESDILSQMASDARVSDAAKCEIKPVLQPQARKIGVKQKNAAEERQFQQRQSKTLHLHNTRKEAGSQ
jgi:hypothetical protein